MNRLKDHILLQGYARSLASDDLKAWQRLWLFRIAGLITCIVIIGFTIQVKVVAPKTYTVINVIYGIFAILCANYFLLAWHKRPRLAYIVLILGWMTIMHVETYYSDGVRNPANFYIPTIILTAYLLLGRIGGLFAVFTAVANFGWFFFIEQKTGWVSNELGGNTAMLVNIYFLIATCSGMFMVSALSRYLVNSKNAIIKDLELKRNELAIKNEELQKLSLVASQTTNGVIITDRQGIVEWVNDGFSRITGYRFDEAAGKQLKELFKNEAAMEKVNAFIESRAPVKQQVELEVIGYTKNGERYWMQMQVQPIVSGSGDPEKFFCIISDITEKVTLQQLVIVEKIAAQQARAKAIIATQEKERSDIGKELHDNVNQILTTAKLYVENVKYYPEQGEVFIEKSRDLIQKSITEIRYLSKVLVAPTIRDNCFRESIFELIYSYKELNQFHMEHHFEFSEDDLDKEMQLTIYRILQELLNNAVKYARASLVGLSIEQSEGVLTLAYKDDGIGFDMHSYNAGLGLNNIKNRVELYKGSTQLISSPGKGCAITISFPMAPNTYEHS